MNFDVAIVGSGLAGLTVALQLADTHRVAILSKRAMTQGASDWAQGGIAAVLDSGDSHDEHTQDTLVAGAGLCDEEATRFIVEHGREAIQWLIDRGVPFTRDAQAELGFHLTREGGHSRRRIIHAADATGHAVVSTLLQQATQHPNITILEDHFAIDLITSRKMGLPGNRCYGLYVLDDRTGAVHTITATHTVLAAGGAGKVYLYTTNPDTATGDGIAMAWRAGCRVSNMEFIQFHPTCLYHPYAKSFLISEAVRGEGGLLKLPDGTRFMPEHDTRAELAPRDVVARAIDFEMKKRGLDCVYLDITHQPEAFLKEHFPTIHARCLELGIDITREPIPVVPAAHYTCGGVVTDTMGRTDIGGLYAVGETACTGLHGANRLASNSLLECMVIGRAAAADIASQDKAGVPNITLPAWDESRVSDADEEVVVSHNWDELRRMMWNYVGIVRTSKRLERAQHRIVLLREEIAEYYANFRVTTDLLELRNLVEVASLIVDSAYSRHESRGLHFSRDYPEALPKALPTVMQPPAVRKR
ncbi:L-aspartate oxidase [Cupriavidus taiwanensis]|uniref:L-aspartate oxidase n=2 Tax=Cupriavidus taiwanensis TaxID=164546 RepID=B3R6D8_CUPTR|nr:L-aspartate oxidase [Cupriavidus taiwanensis]CAQ70442.1 quinolinate synthetase, B subunit, L-aspartate oxidase [Cupriavidus taiwanensis LMG 19424]SOY49602.1 quinolinate synthetase, B subunit, L-aspartate oxidase [Cupriavidus taiwanensis]SOY89002.1 quinolinate synthetase, B subunit, L-aspartate oxidase [Cupriavidus taiwanensis]SOZ03093.1 quinolinate synthetase, B subunit, L-aspartate oxidase [Cupriavidus taiwanensis]SOZ06367.1 quinolinate synthetase, B subunit, L-aspartate oxidase [Cupriavid